MTTPETITVTLTLEEAAILFCSTPMTPARTQRAHMRHFKIHDRAAEKLAAALGPARDGIAVFSKIFYKA